MFADLVACGFGEVRLVASGAQSGFVEVIAASLLGSVWQRCRTHYAANLMIVTLQSLWPAVKVMLHSVDDQPDVATVNAQFDRLPDRVDGKLPDVLRLTLQQIDGTRATPLPGTWPVRARC
ncbi:transposase [Leucobacter aridicollis]|nr:transposase [Leucobacter aridicollis]